MLAAFFSQTVFGILYHRDLVVDTAKKGDSTPAHRNKVFISNRSGIFLQCSLPLACLAASCERSRRAYEFTPTDHLPPCTRRLRVPTRAEKICTYIAVYTISHQKAKKNKQDRTGPRTPPLSIAAFSTILFFSSSYLSPLTPPYFCSPSLLNARASMWNTFPLSLPPVPLGPGGLGS